MSDRRAVAGLVGAVLLFGILIISLSLYQAQVVPSENQRAEFEHSQQVQNQLEDVRNAILRTAWSGNSQPTSVTLGTRYPSRTVAVNPPPATGRLATENLGNVTIRNVYAAGGPEGLQEYLDNQSHNLTYPTSALVYTPDYNEYRGAPQTVYENTLLYNNFTRGGNSTYLNLTGDSLVSASGDRVSLVVLRGDYSESGIGSATVDPESVSTPRGGVYVNGSLNVSLPTRYPVNGTAGWSGLLPDAVNPENASGGHRVNLSTEGGTRLRIGAVSVGSGSTSDPAYITRESARSPQVSGGETTTLSVQVHDEYLNPDAGVMVNASADGRRIQDSNQTTDENGIVRFDYMAPRSGGTYRVNVSFGPNRTEGPRAQWTSFDVNVPEQNDGGGGGGSGGTGSGDLGGPTINWRLDDLSTPGENRVRYVASYEVTNTNGSFDQIEVAFNDYDGSAQGTKRSEGKRGSVEYMSYNGAKHSWDVSLKVIYTVDGSSYVAASRQFTDTADAINPDRNANLGSADSPTIDSFDVADKYKNNPKYKISYTIGNTAQFDQVQGALLSTGSGGSDIKTKSSSGPFTLKTNGNRFVVKLLVYDNDGVVVAYAATEPDQADGVDPTRAT